VVHHGARTGATAACSGKKRIREYQEIAADFQETVWVKFNSEAPLKKFGSEFC